MKLLLPLLLTCSIGAFAQTDTVYRYFDKAWKPVAKDSAFFFAKITHTNGGWHRQDFWVSNNIMQMDGWYEDEATKTEHGSLIFYTETGIARDSNNYVHGKHVSKYVFYPNHTLKCFGIFGENWQVVQQAGYDESGKEIPGYIFQQEARYPGGLEAWQQFLVKGLNSKQPKAFKDGRISGKVTITFLVDKAGNVVEATVETSSGHAELDQHALAIIQKSPKWIPAIQYNKPVVYRQRQSLTYSAP